MTKKDYLVSFRTTSDRWEQFKEWAKGRGNSASSELEGFILQCIGADRDVNTGRESVLTSEIEERLARIEGEIENFPDPAPLVESLRSELDDRVARLEGELADLKKFSLTAA